MTATGHDVKHVTFDHALEDYLDERELRYEVIDGEIVVNAGASWDHEDVANEISSRLRVAAPPELVVLGPNLAFFYEVGSFVLPDVIVCRRADRRPDGLRAAPLLAVEVLSPTTLRKDLGRKKEIYLDAGVPSYWVVDPDARELTVLTLVDGDYQEAQSLSGQQELTVEVPVPVTFRPFG